MSMKKVLSLDASQASVKQTAAVKKVSFSRKSNSWDLNGKIIASKNEPHIEKVDGVSAFYMGRASENLLPKEYASFDKVPAAWSKLASFSASEDAFGKGTLTVSAKKNEVVLPLPMIPFDSEKFGNKHPGTAFICAFSLFSAHVKGKGEVLLRLRNLKDGQYEKKAMFQPVAYAEKKEFVERSFALSEDWERICVGLNGVFAPREMVAEIVLKPGSECSIDGLMFEPYLATHRSQYRVNPYPAPSAWVPGGESRAGDRLDLTLADKAIPASGMIEFWIRPSWDALNPQHCFFKMCNNYFLFEIAAAGPIFYAGQKACEWQYFWEWGQSQGFKKNSWNHFALVWKKEGGATIYLNGQSRAHAQQVPKHALNPAIVGNILSIGSAGDGLMCLDKNPPSQIDAYLSSWNLHSGNVTEADVLAVMEDTRPVPALYPVPAQLNLMVDCGRNFISHDIDHCWFVHNLGYEDGNLYTFIAHEDDHHPNAEERYYNDINPGDAWPNANREWLKSADGGKTWVRGRNPNNPWFKRAMNGLYISFHWRITKGEDIEANVSYVDGRKEKIMMKINLGEFEKGLKGNLWTAEILGLADGTFITFAYGVWEGGGCSVLVFKTKDFKQWKPIWRFPMGHSFNETAAAQLPSGRIVCLMRTGSQGGWFEMLAKCVSDDNGETWSAPVSSGVCGVMPRLDILENGTLVLVAGRPGNIMALSADNGETFSAISCVEDCRIHEFHHEFAWYGYSSENNGLAVDHENNKAYISYDILNVREEGDGTGWNTCYVRGFDLKYFSKYNKDVKEIIPADSEKLKYDGKWTGKDVRVTIETGASVSGTFEGTALVAMVEKSIHTGTALIYIDNKLYRKLPLYLPYRKQERVLLANDLPAGKHKFKIVLETGYDDDHRFATPETPSATGNSAFLTGSTPVRRIAFYQFEILR